VLGWVVLYRYLLLFFICFVSFDPFLRKLVAIEFVIRLYHFVIGLLVVVFGLSLFLRILYETY
jgi:hypothetical protein